MPNLIPTPDGEPSWWVILKVRAPLFAGICCAGIVPAEESDKEGGNAHHPERLWWSTPGARSASRSG
eukprot:1016839-Rhodomonas_salina.1